MTEATANFTVGVVLERRPAVTQWADVVWRALAVLPGVPDLAPGTKLWANDGGEQFFAGAFDVDLHRTDTPTYRDNLATSAPLVWVILRPNESAMPHVAAVTVDPAEGEAYSETGTLQVESVPMPPEIAGVVAAFVAEHHVEREFIKRKRRRWADADSEDLA